MVPGCVRPILILTKLQVIKSSVWTYAGPHLTVGQARLVIFLVAQSMFIIVRPLWAPIYWTLAKPALWTVNVLQQPVLRGLAEKFVYEMLIASGTRSAEQRS